MAYTPILKGSWIIDESSRFQVLGRRHGFTWTDAESYDLLVGYFDHGASISELASMHHRGGKGIACKLDEILSKPGEQARLRKNFKPMSPTPRYGYTKEELKKWVDDSDLKLKQPDLFEYEYIDPALVDLTFEGGKLAQVKVRRSR